MRILYTFLVYLISIGYSSVYAAKSYTWTGATNGNWQTTSNWSPSTGFPVDGDDVTINAGTNVPKLDQARTFKNFTISGNKSLDLNGFTLSISGAATFTSGSIISTTGNGTVSVNANSNSTFGSAGNTMTFGSSSNSVNVQSICPRIFVNGTLTVNGNLEFEKTKTTADSWVSGITVNGNTKISCSQSGGSSGIIIGTTAGTNIFNGNLELNNSSSSQIILGGVSGSISTVNGNVKLVNTNTGAIDFAYSTSGNTTPNNATININGNIEFNNTSTGSIGFGRNSTLSTPAITLASDKGIAVGADGGFTNGTIIFRSFTYGGTSPINFTTTGGSVNFLDKSTFNCPITISAANIALNGTTFNGAVDFTKTNNTAYNCTGLNTFNQSVILTNTGTSNWIFGTTNPDIFNKQVTLRNTSTGAIYIGYSSLGNQFNDNIILDETGTGSIRFGGTTNNPITFAEGKSITIANSTSPGLLVFNKITFPSNTPISLDLGCSASLNFISCTLNSSVNVKAGSYELQSNNFNAPVTIEKCGSVTGANDLVYGGNIFSLNAPVHFINSSLIHLVLCQSAPDIYNADFTLTSSNNNYIYASNVANGTQYNGNIILNKTSGNFGFDFGNGTNAFSTLADGKTISLNASSALSANWYLSIRKITQNGNTIPSPNPINIASGNYCILTLTQNEFNSAVNVTSAGAIQLATNTFWQPCYFELTGAIAGTGNGGNNYKNTVIFKHSGTANWIHANITKDVFENDVTVISTNTGNIYLAYNSLGNEFKGDIIINKNSGTGSMLFGNGTNASSTLANGKTIKIGSEFSIGGLNISRLTQQGSTPISLTSTGTSTIAFGVGNTFNGNITLTGTSTGATSFTSNILNGGLTIKTPGNTTFTGNTIIGNIDILNSGTSIVTFGANNTVNGALSAIAPSVLFTGTGSIYNGIVNVTINGNATTYYWQGTQVFNNDVIVNHNTSSANLYITLSATHTFKFLGNVTFNKNAAGILVSCYGVCEFYKDVTYNYTGGLGYWPYHFGYNGGVTKFLGSNPQTVSSNNPNGLECFSILIDKPQNHVTLTTKINMVSSPYPVVAAPVLTLNNGNLICKGSSFVSLRNTGANGEVTSGTSWVVGGSANSFVDGPFIKVGTGAFTFPIGKGTLAGSPIYAPIAISAPATSSTFQAEAFIATPSNNTSTDATIKNISNCQYWNVQRMGGTSNVQITLPWDATTCTLINPSNLKVARFNGTTWTNAGANNLINTPPTGSITSNTTNNSFGLYTFGIDAPLTVTATNKDACFGQNNGTITLTVSGGKYPYSYSWSNGATTQNLTALSEGTYNVTVTDALGATQSASVTINAATEIIVGLNLNGRDVQTSVTGGVTPYTYLWSNNSTNASQTALASGTYTLTVTDANGCKNSTLASVTVIDPLTQKVVRIAAGNRHSIKICDGGTLYVWGNNNFGQLGDGSTTEKIVPTNLLGTTGFVSASAGVDYTIALKNDGSVWAWGNNEYGQLGIGNSTESHIPVQINSLTDIVTTSAGKYHSLALKNDGTVYAWGKNNYGQLGNGTNIDSNIPVLIPNLSGVIALTTGETHSVILKSDGTVWSFGDNIGGQLGNGTWDSSYEPVQVSGLTGVKAISSGEGHTIALKNDGTVWTWGYSGSASLGDGNTYNSNVPKQLITLSGIASIIAGETYGLALKNDGTVWVWGENGDGQLGDGTYNDHPIPVQLSSPTNIIELAAGDGNSMVLNGDGILYSFGDNRNGQLGDGTKEDRITPVSVYAPGGCFVPDCSTFEISAGTDQTIFRGASVTLNGGGATSYSWNNSVTDGIAFNPTTTTTYTVTGTDDRGCSDTAQVKVTVLDPLTQKIVKISAGGFSSAKICDDGSLYTWGNTNNSNKPIQATDITGVVAVSLVSSNTFVLKNDGTVWAKGSNYFGQLGNGTTQNSSSYTQVLNLNNIVDIKGGEHSIALRNDGTVWEWGHIHGYDFNLATTPVKVSSLEKVISIAGDGGTFFALKLDGTVWAWGSNYWGSIGDGTTQDRDTPVQILSDVASLSSLGGRFAIKNDGTVVGWGYNNYGEVGNGSPSARVLNPVPIPGFSDVAKIYAGDGYSFAIKNDGTVWAWGKNDAGQFGNGSTTNSLNPIQITGLSNVNDISIGSLHSLILKNDGVLLASGSNGYGQLGDGSPTVTSGKGGGLPAYKTTPTSVYVAGGCFVPDCSGLTINAGNDQTLVYGTSLSLTASVIGATSVSWNNGITNGVAFNPPIGSTSYIVTASNNNGCLVTDTVIVKVELPQTKIKLAACDHSVKVCDDGSVYSWGSNVYGALGDGTTTSRNLPGIVPNLQNVVAVSAGVTNTLALKNDGTVWAWGLNLHGNLGNGTMTDASSPVQVSDLTGIVSMDTKFHHVLALKNDGTVWAWGYNVYGELGRTGMTTSTSPLMVPGLNSIIAVETGSYHSVALKVDGTVWAWGRNGSGELGDGTTNDRYLPMQVNGLVNIKQISALTQATYALTQDGHLYAWGANSGLIGDGTTSTYYSPVNILSNVAEILSGGSQTIIVRKDDGTVWGWGTNTTGQLNDGSTTNRSTPVLLSNFYSDDIICLGSSHVLIQNNDGTLFSEGYNANGQLGDGTNTNHYTPVSVYVPGGCFIKPACAVSNTNDSGPGSLRAAIECANSMDSHSQISFRIPGVGPYTIHCQSPLPNLINTHGITIDGKTQSLSGKGTGNQTIILDNARFNIIEGSNTLSNISFVNGRGMYVQSSGNQLEGLVGDHTTPIVIEGGGNNIIKDCKILNPNSPTVVLSSGTGGNEIYNTTLRGEQSPTLIAYSNSNTFKNDSIYNNKAHAFIITDNSSNNIIDSTFIRRETFLGASDTTTYSYYSAGLLFDGANIQNNLITNSTIIGFSYGLLVGTNAQQNTFRNGIIRALDYGLFINGNNNIFDSNSIYALYSDRSRIGALITSKSNTLSSNHIEGFTADGILLEQSSTKNKILNNDIIGTTSTLYPTSAYISTAGPFITRGLFQIAGVVNHGGNNEVINNFIENYYSGIRITMDSAIVSKNILGRMGAIGIYISSGTNYDFNSIIEGNYIGFNKNLTNSLITGVGIGFYGTNGINVINNKIGNIQRFSTNDPLNGEFVGKVPNVDGCAIAGLYGGGQNININNNIIGENGFGVAAPIENIGINLNNSIANHTVGQFVWNSSIINNKIRNYTKTGIEIGTSWGDKVIGNDVQGGEYGLKVLTASDNKIINNKFDNHSNGYIFVDKKGGSAISGYDFYLTHQNFISRNSYQNNGALKNINLNYDDLSQVANEGKQAPVLLNLLGGTSITINGTALAGDTIEIYEVIGSGTLKTYTYITSIVTTSNNWTANFPITMLQGGNGSTITATATDTNGNTSEFGNEITGCSTCCYVTTTADSGPGSLREAINCANSSNDPSTIAFNIPGDGDHIMIITSAKLPDILYSTVIDGSTQPSGKIVIANYGWEGFNFKNGIANQSSVINAINYVNSYAVAYSSQQSLRINNVVGDKLTFAFEDGTTADSLIITNSSFKNGEFIAFGNHAPKFVSVQNCIIDNCPSFGIYSNAALPTTEFQIINNKITHCHASYSGAIDIYQAKSISIFGNQISGNLGYGINLAGIKDKSAIKGNVIGLSFDKKSAMPNQMTGVNISGCNIVYIDSNYIGGNSNADGIYLNGGVARITRNYIGTNENWDNLGNGSGIYMSKEAGTIIGGSTLDSANFIGFNRGNGIVSTYGGTIIQYNYIGVSPTFSNIGNNGAGIYSEGESLKIKGNYIGYNKNSGISNFGGWQDIYSDNFIGGNLVHNFANGKWGLETYGYGVVKNNIISNNTLGGISVLDSELKITQNIFNGTQPIAISLGGYANNNKQPGTFTTSSFTATSLRLNGTGNDGDTIEVFHNDGVSETALVYAGYAVVTNGKWSLNIPQGPAYDPLNENFYVNTATDNAGNTSQLSALYKIGFCTVINTDDSGPGSLREAINCANSLPYAGRIRFAIPGNGPYEITLQSPIAVTNPFGVTLNGNTQIASGAGASGTDQTVKVKSSMLVFIQDAGPSSVTNMSFSDYAFGLFSMADSFTVRDNKFYGSGVRVILSSTPNAGKVDLSNNTFDQTSAAIDCESINGLTIQNNSVNASGSGSPAIFVRQSKDINLRDNNFDNTLTSVYSVNNNRFVVRNNNVRSAVSGTGIAFNFINSKNVNIDTNNVLGRTLDFSGISLNQCDTGTVNRNNIYGVKTGLIYSVANDFTIDHNTILNFSDGIIYSNNYNQRLLISNNTVRNGTGIGLLIGGINLNVLNNYVDTVGTGIRTVSNQGVLNNCVFANNQVYNFTQGGIDIGQGDNNSFHHNTIGKGLGFGIRLFRGHSNLKIYNNFIGISPQFASLPIQGHGIVIGMTNASGGPLIKYNQIGNISDLSSSPYGQSSGIISSSGGVQFLSIQNNYIGIDSLNNPHPIQSYGLLLRQSPINGDVQNNIVANSAVGLHYENSTSNLIKHNSFVNILNPIELSSGKYNRITVNNFVTTTSSKVINLNLSTPQVANEGKPVPTIASFKMDNTEATVTGQTEPGDVVEIYQATGSNPLTYTYIRSVTADPQTGFWIAYIPKADIKDINNRSILFATATDADNNTSEFSAGYSICPVCECIVTNINDSGAGSFREAINCANSMGNGAKIKFNIPIAALDTILIESTLPMFNANVEVDGTSQPGFVAGQSPKIFIKNISGASRGLVFTQANSTIRGIGMKNFAPSLIFTSDADNSLVEYCTVVNDGFSIALAGDGDNIQVMGCHFGITHNGDGQGSGNAPGLVINNAVIGSKDKPNVITNYFYAGIWGNNTVLYNTIYGNGDPSTKKAIYSPDRIPSGHSVDYGNFVWKIKGVAPANSRIQLFVNNGIQQQALAFADELFADANGNWTYVVPNQYLPKTKNSYFVYTYTEATSKLTSELSAPITVGNFVTQCFVTNTNNDGKGSLRDAINNCANTAANHAEIVFQLPDNGARINGSLIPVSRTIEVFAPSFQFSNPNGITMDGTTAWVKLVAKENVTTILTSNSNSNVISRIAFDGSNASGAVDLGGNYSVFTNCEITNVGFRSGSIYGNNHVISNNYIHGITVEDHQGMWLQGNNLNFTNNYIGIKPDGTDSKVKVSSFGSVVVVGDKVTVKNNTIGNIDTAAVDNTSKAAIFVYNSSLGKVNILNNTIGKFNGRAIPVPTIGIALTGCDNSDCPTNDLISGNTIANCRFGISARGNGDTISNNTFIDISEVAILNFGKMTLDPVANPDHVSYLTRNLIFNTPEGKKGILSDIENPVIARFYHGTWDWLIEGTSIPNATIELFLSDGLGDNAIKYLNTVKANASGYWSLTVPDEAIDVEQEYLYVTATATTTGYVTSGLSNLGVLHIQKCTVESIEDSGPKTLRECITLANAGDVNYIKFNITTSELPVEINITDVLPTITTLAKGLIINGATQPGTLPKGKYNKVIVKNVDEVNYGFTIGDVTGVALRNISVKNFATGLYYTGAANKTKAMHVEITGHTASGVLVDASCGDSVRITQSRIKGERLAEYGIHNHAAGAYFDTLLVDGHTKSGIYVEGTDSKSVSDVVIAGDTLTNNYPKDRVTQTDYTGGFVGMYMIDSKVSGNIAYENNYAVFLGFASNNEISENSSYKGVKSISETTENDTIINVGNGVDALHTLSSSDNTINSNEFNYCMNGISLNSSDGNNISAGTVSYNSLRGIEVAASTGVTIESVSVNSNEYDGIYVGENSDATVIKKCHIGSSDKNFKIGDGNEYFGVNLQSSNNSVTDNIIGFNKKGAVNVSAATNSNKVVRNYLYPDPSKPTALSININRTGNTAITPPTITSQSSSGKFITLSGGGVDDGDSVHIYRNRGYFQEANTLLAAVKAEGNAWTATIDTTLLFDDYSAYVVATTTDQDNNTSQLSDMYSLGYCVVNTQDDNGNNTYPTNASLRMAVNCMNSSQVKARMLVNIEEARNPVINLKGSVLPSIFNDHGVDMNGRNKFFNFIKDTKLQVQRDASVSETLGGDYIFELTNTVDKATIRNFVINNGRGIKAESDTLQLETTIFVNPYSSLVDASYAPSAVTTDATSQGLWLSGNDVAVIHKVSLDKYSNGMGSYQVGQLRVDSSSFTNSIVGLWSTASSDLSLLNANKFEGNNSVGVFFGPLNNGEIVANSNTFSGKGIGMTLLGAKHASIYGNTFNTIVSNTGSAILDSDNNNGIGVYLLDSTGTVQILNNTFNNVRGAAISFDKDANLGGLPYVGTAYPDSVLIYQNNVLSDTIAFNIKGRSHSVNHNNVKGSIIVKESKRSQISLNTIAGKNGFINMSSSDSVVVSKNSITGFIGRNDSKAIHLNKGTANVSNGGKNAPIFDNNSSLIENNRRIRVAITGKAHPFDDVELFKSDTLKPYLISYVNTVSANANGEWTYIVPTEEVPIKNGDFYIATATSPDTLRTSETSAIFYLRPQIYDIIVRNTNDAGANSLRNALNLVTMYDPFVNVKFRIPGEGPYRISIDSAYKAVTSENGFTLDANTQVQYAIDSTGLDFDDDLRVIVDGSHLTGTTSLDTAAVEVDNGPNKSFIRALNIENFKRGYLLKSSGFRLSSLRLHNENPTTLEGAAVELDSTTAEKIVIDTVNVDNFDIAFLLRDTIAGGNSISNSAIENVNTGFMLEDCDRMKLTNNTIVKFNVAGIHWTMVDTTKVKTKEEDFAVVKDNYIGFLPYETVTASSGTGIILDGVKEETINANFIGNLTGDVDGIKVIGNSKKLILKLNTIGDDGFGTAQPIVGNGIRLLSDGDTLTENFISENDIKNVSGAGVVLHGTHGNIVAANKIGDTSATSTIGYGVIVRGWGSTQTAANERVYDNKINNYTQHGIFCEYADSVTMNRNILMSKVAPATSKGINLNLTEGSASNNRKQAPLITDVNVLSPSMMEIKGDGVPGEKIELFTTTDENTIQALEFAGHIVVQPDNHWSMLVYPPLVRFDKPIYIVATATEVGTGRTSELSAVKVKNKTLCDLHSGDILPAVAAICPSDKFIADLNLGKELSYEWSFNGQKVTYLTGPKSDLSRDGDYSILVTDLGVGIEQCSLTVNFKLEYLDDPYKPKILMATEVVAGDTIAAFDVADEDDFDNKNTDKWEWTKDADVLIWDIGTSDGTGDHRKYNMVFPAPGTYQIKLTTTNEGPCKEEDSKTITVYDQAALKEMQSDIPTEIMEVIAYPNPTDGDFAVKVTLNKWDDIYLDLYSSTGVLVYSSEAYFKKQHVFGISSNGLASGMYYVNIRSGSMRQVVKVVLSK